MAREQVCLLRCLQHRLLGFHESLKKTMILFADVLLLLRFGLAVRFRGLLMQRREFFLLLLRLRLIALSPVSFRFFALHSTRTLRLKLLDSTSPSAGLADNVRLSRSLPLARLINNLGARDACLSACAWRCPPHSAQSALAHSAPSASIFVYQQHVLGEDFIWGAFNATADMVWQITLSSLSD